jgi:beta-glucosidase
MFDKFIKRRMKRLVGTQENTTFALAGIHLEDSTVIPDIEPAMKAEEKAEVILGQMTLDEKMEMLGGVDNMAIKGNERLNLPRVWCSDASAGVRCFQRATAFPVPVAMAATWNRPLLWKVGEAIGRECRAKGVSILLGPGVNIYRVPTCGRNFEYMGEDPFLAGELAVPYIKGVQSTGVIATVKHFACNNSDYDRHRMNSKVDERTLQEIYYPAFKAAIQKGGVKAVMNSYNPVNGVFASENHDLLTRVLREDWGFKGFVISDWISVYSTDKSIKAGLDLEMPKGAWLNPGKIRKSMDKGLLTEEDIDRPVKNLLTTFFEMGVYNRPLKDRRHSEYSRKNSLISLEAAREAIVLLKNESVLPLDVKTIKSIVVVGKMAEETTTCGGGSCNIESFDKISILEGIRQVAGESVTISYLAAENNKLTDSDKSAISAADAVVASVGFTGMDESEFYDKSWTLPDGQDQLIRQVAGLNPNTIVTLTTGSGLETKSWVSSVPALLHCFFLGEQGGKAVAEIIFGQVTPSGKLPFTMARKWTDFEATKNYVKNQDKISLLRIFGPQGINGIRKAWDLEYKERLMVGYRHFDTNGVEPGFPFGFGLSYTSFFISAASLSKNAIPVGDLKEGAVLEVVMDVQNTGSVSGAEVVQLYIKDLESQLPRPEKELKAFEKIRLEPGEKQGIKLSLDAEAFSYFDDSKGRWVIEPGEFKLLIGSSSRSIVLELDLEIT